MIILIPLGGTGERFKINGYDKPKSLIKVNNKQIIFHLIDNLNISKDVDFVYIPYNKEYVNYDFEKIISNRYPNIVFKFLMLEENTRGAADTVRIALEHLPQQEKDDAILCIDSDNFYTTNIIQIWDGENKIFTFIDKLDVPRYSYVTTVQNTNIITNIVEKEKISDIACCGSYGFKSWKDLLYYTQYTIDKGLKQKNEYYISSVIKTMINTTEINFKCEIIENKYYYSLGTPEQVNEFEYSFLFDLDGTLVNTDDIYIQVWDDIFKKYNFGFNINKIFFDNFIKGKNDSLFLQYLLPNIDKKLIHEISELKDELFIKFLKESNRPILLPGVVDFFEKNKNRRIGIVTSCNRISAEYILNYTSLNEYICLLITSNECIKHKPSPEPYLKALTELDLNPNKTIIFEDSYSGYTSAKNTDVYKIILICNEHSCLDIKNANEFKIRDYTELDIKDILYNKTYSAFNKQYICESIKNELIKYQPVKEVVYNDIHLKTGYICDIQSYKIIFNDDSTENIVLKINNFDNELSKTAEKMNLYNNEINFYTEVNNSITDDIVRIPKCYGVISINNETNQKGIILENLFKYQGQFHIDLNKNIKMLTNVINEIANLHNRFYFKTIEDVPLNMRNVTTMKQLLFFKELIETRFQIFIKKNKMVLKQDEIDIMFKYYNDYDNNISQTSTFPLSFCHGDLKSANIFYKNYSTPYLLDWQYIQLNKGVSDICFLLVESIKFDKITVEVALKYYYCLISNHNENYTYEDFMNDFKVSLGVFPFVVCVWFNSEDSDKLIDNVFPIKFMKNVLEYMKWVNTLQ